MEKVAEVEIDSDGVFKYILVELTDKKSGKEKTIVRGYEWAEYHGRFRNDQANNKYFIFLIFS